MRDEVRLHGLVIGRVSVDLARNPSAKGASATIKFKPDHVGMMHAAARDLDKERER